MRTVSWFSICLTPAMYLNEPRMLPFMVTTCAEQLVVPYIRLVFWCTTLQSTTLQLLALRDPDVLFVLVVPMLTYGFAVRCRRLRMSLANTGTISTGSNAISGTSSSEQTPFADGLRRQASGEEVDIETAPGGLVFAPAGATPASGASALIVESIAQHSLGKDSGRSLGTDDVSTATTSATPENGRTRGTTATKKDGAQKTPPAPTKPKSVRFEDGTVGGETPGSPMIPRLGTTIRAPPPAIRTSLHGQNLWKLGKERRTWKGSPSSGTPTYGSIDDITSDEGDGNWDEEMGGASAKRGVLTTARRSFHGHEGGVLGKPGSSGGAGVGGGLQSGALLTQDYESDDSPGGRRGWRDRVSKWYHDF